MDEPKDYVSARSVAFARAFPMIASLSIRVEVRREGFTQPKPEVWSYSLENPPDEYIRCPRSPKDCKKGGWPITTLIREMVAQRETHRQVQGSCEGYEPMARRSGRPCKAYFKADIEIRYNE